jgi:pimeloyl-ACP methyl ester carboxylesterase
VPAELVTEEVEQARERRSHDMVESDFLDAARSVISTVARRRRYRDRLSRLSRPVLLVHGTRDRLVPLAVARSAARANPRWTYVELHDVGHVPQLEAAEDTAWVMLDWLSSLTPVSRG